MTEWSANLTQGLPLAGQGTQNSSVAYIHFLQIKQPVLLPQAWFSIQLPYYATENRRVFLIATNYIESLYPKPLFLLWDKRILGLHRHLVWLQVRASQGHEYVLKKRKLIFCALRKMNFQLQIIFWFIICKEINGRF